MIDYIHIQNVDEACSTCAVFDDFWVEYLSANFQVNIHLTLIVIGNDGETKTSTSYTYTNLSNSTIIRFTLQNKSVVCLY